VAAPHHAIEQCLEARRLYAALVSQTKRQLTGPTLDCPGHNESRGRTTVSSARVASTSSVRFRVRPQGGPL
jgi:hypothetical protein